MSTRFRPVRGDEAKILGMPYNEGYLYFATDTGNIFIDSEGKEKFPLGGRGAAVLYSTKAPSLNSGDDFYTIFLEDMEDPSMSVRVGDLIISSSDGGFYKVVDLVEAEETITCQRIAISGSGGSGGGGSSLAKRGKMTVRNLGESDILNGSDCMIYIKAISALNDVGEIMDESLQLTITYILKDTNQIIYTEESTITNGIEYTINVKGHLRDSSNMKINFKVKGSDGNVFLNGGSADIYINTHKLSIDWISDQFSNLNYFEDKINTAVRFSTGMSRVVDIYFDEYLVFTRTYSSTSTDTSATPTITSNSVIYNEDGSSSGSTLGDAYSHGRHTIKAKLSLCKFDGSRGAGTDLITKEIGLYIKKGYPLIWFGDMQTTYYEYDNPLVPIRVFDPNANADIAEVFLYIDGADALDGSYYTISNNTSEYLYWTLTGLVAGQHTTYEVRVGEGDFETKEIVPEFEVLEDSRHMDIVRSALSVNFDSRGRSNSENVQKRTQLKIGDKNASLEGFNWYNNGWIMDDNNITCLRISNGATVKFPLGAMAFGKRSRTIEMRLKIRNVQTYDKLITNYTRYQVISDPDKLSSPLINRNWNDDDIFAEFLAQKATGLSSYDAYLTKRLPELRETDPTIPTYEDLEFSRLARQYDLASAMAKYISNEEKPDSSTAICLGPQDGYFSNGTNSVTVDYVEDNILNLSIVYNYGEGNLGNNKLMKFYLNGMLTSVARSTAGDTWNISASDFIFNSTGCDIDLYKFRVYDKALGLDEILKNVAYDNTDIVAWDLSALSSSSLTYNEPYQFSYKEMIKYNKEHGSGYIMPYIIFTTDDSNTSTGGKLPWRKDTPVSAQVEFVNTGLEYAYSQGQLDALAKKEGVTIQEYYLHHCPSWISDNATLSVQGTSSEFYPRRNFKAKTKVNKPVLDENGSESLDEFGDVVTKSVYTMKLNRGPFAEEYNAGKAKGQKFFYFDNNTVGTNKFTLKVDYMESSGTYNMGLANLVNTAYTHHPLLDYNSAKAFVKGTAGKETLMNSYPADGLCWYRNHKGNWKCASTGDAGKDKTLITDVYGDVLGDISCANASDFAKKPWVLAQEQGQSKVLGGTKKVLPDINDIDTIKQNIADTSENGTYDDLKDFINNWYSYTPGSLSPITVGNLSDYRTSVQGFPTLAFWWTKSQAEDPNAEPLFIGRYNMLLDKGSAEAYGFKLGSEYQQAFVDGNPAVSDVAECWEFENNSRGFCSFRDPWNRKDLSFKAPVGVSNEFTANGAPIVADYFEYRYNANDDYIDMLYNMNKSFENQNTIKKLQKQFGADKITDKESGCTKMLDLYSNWEKAVAWVWSTATDAVINGKAVPALGTYTKVDVYQYLFVPNKFYIEDPDKPGEYKLAESYTAGIPYYELDTNKNFKGVTVTNNNDSVYVASKYYTLQNGNYVLAEDEYDASNIYYKLTEASNIDEFWRLPSPVTYGNTTYEYDTQEYRLAKFKNEITDHFNIEYLITYFVITEVLECYDSRGKNAMFASWGPQKSGGDYIWYPIFYDMDTQLGINNTGIPSFEYNIDATEDGTFSTNDSVLWNNLYALFKNLIVAKYEQLTGVPTDLFNGKLNNPPFVSVDMIESWYTCDPKFTNSFSMMGIRPLIALNCDEQYKYISITNDKVGYPYQDGEITQDTSNTYFYALQGDRKMSRRQFLTNRLNYINSWLAVGNYKRGGANRIRSRISANNSQNTSDKWIEGTAINGDSGLVTNVPYYKEDGKTKTHLFDGEYWITMTPTRNMYVTVGTDAANFPSLKYSGTPVRFETSDLEKGVRESGNYREQLYYVYGLDQMKSLGDLSRLYFQEFELSGKANKMTDLLLGYDGVDEEGNQYKNNGVNDWTIPAAAGTLTGGMPLLKEVNLSNITFRNNNITFDFSSCEKLENFRNTGSNITQVTFADGVSLNTLYLSRSTTSFKLTEARLLTNLITKYSAPKQSDPKDLTSRLVAEPGLYIEDLTDGKNQTLITTMDIQGGNLGYYSYKLLDLYCKACKNTAPNLDRNINMTSVQWSPYIKISDPEYAFSATGVYYKDNGHYGLEPYTADNYKASEWIQLINNGMMYEYSPSSVNGIERDSDQNIINITNINLFDDLINNVHYVGTAENSTIPNITGYVYINNDTTVDEGEIQKTLTSKFPGLTFFFKKVTKGYSARFVILEDGIETLIGTDKLSATQTNEFFINPFDRTESAFSPTKIDSMRATKNFLGWSTTNDRSGLIETYDVLAGGLGIPAKHDWNKQKLKANQYDYTYYAVFEDRFWTINFVLMLDDKNSTPVMKNGNPVSFTVIHAHHIPDPEVLVRRDDESDLSKEQRYRFIGFTRTANTNKNIYNSVKAASIVDVTKEVAVKNQTFYAAFVLESVYDSATDDKYFNYNLSQGGTGYSLTLKPEYRNDGFGGKVTLPTSYKNLPILSIGGFEGSKVTHVFFKDNNCKVTVIDDAAFQNVSSLVYFEYPDTIVTLSSNAFHNCTGLEPFVLNKGLKTISDAALNVAFSDKYSHDLYIPGSVEYIGSNGLAYQGARIGKIIIGGPGDANHLTTLGSDWIGQNDSQKANEAIIYGKISVNEEQLRADLRRALKNANGDYTNPSA